MSFKRLFKDKYAGSSPENASVVRTLFDLFLLYRTTIDHRITSQAITSIGTITTIIITKNRGRRFPSQTTTHLVPLRRKRMEKTLMERTHHPLKEFNLFLEVRVRCECVCVCAQYHCYRISASAPWFRNHPRIMTFDCLFGMLAYSHHHLLDHFYGSLCLRFAALICIYSRTHGKGNLMFFCE